MSFLVNDFKWGFFYLEIAYIIKVIKKTNKYLLRVVV